MISGRVHAVTWGAIGAAALTACGIGVERDLSRIPPREVIYDDLCGVQDYHDTLLMNKADPPSVANTNELESTEGKRRSGGRTTFAFEAPYQLQTLRRVLRENWKRVPDEIMKAERVALEVRWSEKAGVRRVVTTEDASIGVGREMEPLPYHVCLSELLFGGPLYHTRRQLLGLSPLAPEPATPANAVESATPANDAESAPPAGDAESAPPANGAEPATPTGEPAAKSAP